MKVRDKIIQIRTEREEFIQRNPALTMLVCIRIDAFELKIMINTGLRRTINEILVFVIGVIMLLCLIIIQLRALMDMLFPPLQLPPKRQLLIENL